MTGHPFAHADAAYVMGALDPDEATAFEYHLADCADCRAQVAEARSTVALLTPIRDGGLSLDDLRVEDVPQTLLPGLLRRAERERSRRRWLTAVVSGVAAACLVMLVTLVGWPSSSSHAPARPAAQALQPLVPGPVRADAVLVGKHWGTEIDLHCKYEYRTRHTVPYGLRVVDRNDRTYDVGTWRLQPGREIDFVGGTEVRRDRIAKVQVTLPDGTPILQLAI